MPDFDEDSVAILPLIEDRIPGTRGPSKIGMVYVVLLYGILAFIVASAATAYQSASTSSAYKHAKTCTGTPPATLDPTCITLVGFEDAGFTSGTAAHPGSELTLYRDSEEYGTVRFPGMTPAINDYPVPFADLGIQFQVQGDISILNLTEPGFNGAVWQGKVIWVADANGVRYQSTEVPGAVPVIAIIALGALSALFLLVLHLRRKYGARRRPKRGLGPVVTLITLAAMTLGITELALGAGWAVWIAVGAPVFAYTASAEMPVRTRPRGGASASDGLAL